MAFTYKALEQLKAEFATFLSSTEKCSGAVFGEGEREKKAKTQRVRMLADLQSHLLYRTHCADQTEFCESHTKP